MDETTRDAVVAMLRQVWQAVGPDYLAAVDGGPADADDVRDAVACRADRKGLVGKRHEEARAAYCRLAWDEREPLLKAAFPDGQTYGY